MKHCHLILLFIAYLFSCYSLHAKVLKNPNVFTKNKKDRSNRFTEEEIQKLKNTKTVFFLRDQDMDLKQEWEQAINSVWDLTEIIVDSYQNIGKYEKKTYSVFVLTGSFNHVTKQSIENGMRVDGVSYDITHVYLSLRVFANVGYTDYCSVPLFPDYPTMMRMGSDSKENFLYHQNSVIKNWIPGLLKLYLIDVQKYLKQSKKLIHSVDINLKKELSGLKNDTLLIPDFVLIKYNMWKGTEFERHNIDKLFKSYPYPYRVVSAEELTHRVLSRDNVYVFDYIKSSASKYVRILSTSSGRIYQRFKGVSYNIKSKNIARFKRKIK